MFGSTYLGSPFGVRLSVHGTFWLLPLFVLLTGLDRGPASAAVDVAVVLALFGCVALHELGHAAAAKLFGIRTRGITLYPIGGVAQLERMPRRPMQEIVVALAGPAVNFGIAAVLAALMAIDGISLNPVGSTTNLIDTFWSRLLWGNVGLVLFNLLPAFPMDGGRVLRAVLAMLTSRRTATDLAAFVGAGFAVLFGVWGLVSFSPMLLILAVFLYFAGQAEKHAVRRDEEEREYRQRYVYEDYDPQPRVFEIPVARPVRRATPVLHGWVFDADTGRWVEYVHGTPVRRV